MHIQDFPDELAVQCQKFSRKSVLKQCVVHCLDTFFREHVELQDVARQKYVSDYLFKKLADIKARRIALDQEEKELEEMIMNRDNVYLLDGGLVPDLKKMKRVR